MYDALQKCFAVNFCFIGQNTNRALKIRVIQSELGAIPFEGLFGFQGLYSIILQIIKSVTVLTLV